MNEGNHSKDFVLKCPKRWFGMEHKQMNETQCALQYFLNCQSFIYNCPERWDAMDHKQMHNTRFGLERNEVKQFIYDYPQRWDNMIADQMIETGAALIKSDNMAAARFVRNHPERWDHRGPQYMRTTLIALCTTSKLRDFILQNANIWDGMNKEQIALTYKALKCYEKGAYRLLKQPEIWCKMRADAMKAHLSKYPSGVSSGYRHMTSEKTGQRQYSYEEARGEYQKSQQSKNSRNSENSENARRPQNKQKFHDLSEEASQSLKTLETYLSPVFHIERLDKFLQKPSIYNLRSALKVADDSTDKLRKAANKARLFLHSDKTIPLGVNNDDASAIFSFFNQYLEPILEEIKK